MIFVTSFTGKDGHQYSGLVDSPTWALAREYVKQHPRGENEIVDGVLRMTVEQTPDGPITEHFNGDVPEDDGN